MWILTAAWCGNTQFICNIVADIQSPEIHQYLWFPPVPPIKSFSRPVRGYFHPENLIKQPDRLQGWAAVLSVHCREVRSRRNKKRRKSDCSVVTLASCPTGNLYPLFDFLSFSPCLSSSPLSCLRAGPCKHNFATRERWLGAEKQQKQQRDNADAVDVHVSSGTGGFHAGELKTTLQFTFLLQRQRWVHIPYKTAR